jgi:hypothetical protein
MCEPMIAGSLTSANVDIKDSRKERSKIFFFMWKVLQVEFTLFKQLFKPSEKAIT